MQNTFIVGLQIDIFCKTEGSVTFKHEEAYIQVSGMGVWNDTKNGLNVKIYGTFILNYQFNMGLIIQNMGHFLSSVGVCGSIFYKTLKIKC